MIDPRTLALPVIAAPLFIVSGPELVIACCRSGIVGSFPALNARTSEQLDTWLTEIGQALEGTEQPVFAVNLIVHKTNPRLEADLALCVKHQVPLIITSLGAVPELVDTVHGYGGQVFHDVIKRRHAQKAADAGVDGLIAVSAGAGGHAGTINPFALITEIRQFFDKTLVLAGGLTRGGDILAAQAAGADLAYLGTRFICTVESRAQDGHKRMIETARADDIVYTDKVSGVAANFLKASLEAAASRKEQSADGSGEAHQGKSGELDMSEAEARAWRDIWSAGHGVGGIGSTPSVQELVGSLKDEYRLALQRVQRPADRPMA